MVKYFFNFNIFFNFLSILEGLVPNRVCAMDRYLVSDLTTKVTINDASLPVLCLLNALYAVSMHWTTLYPAMQGQPILLQQVSFYLEFLSEN